MSGNIAFFSQTNFQAIFILGFIIVVFYARDKFNVPTYDRDALGPFAHLPPQSWTIDTRFRHGRTLYVVLLLCLYTAVCLIGPITFQDPNLSGAIGQGLAAAQPVGFQLGPTFPIKDPTIWPVVAATFLVASGSVNDSSVLGRIKFFIRQYAHKTAYIPSVVSDLAQKLRSIDLRHWFKENNYTGPAELERRRAALSELMGHEVFAEFEKSNEREGELAAWGRANALFYTLQQIFWNSRAANARLETLTSLAENREIFDRLAKTREELVNDFRAHVIALGPQNGASSDPHGEAGSASASLEEQGPEPDELFVRVQRFSREVSLMIALLLTQAARNASYLSDQLDRFGFEALDLRDRSDHFVFATLVNLFICGGACCALIVTALLWQTVVGRAVISGHFLTGVVFGILIQLIVYLCAIKALDYARDRDLSTFEWHEDLSGYVPVLVTSTIGASAVAFVIITLLFSALGTPTWADVFGLVLQVTTVFLLSGLAIAFGLRHYRTSARMVYPRPALHRLVTSWSLWSHATLAAALTAAMTSFFFVHDTRTVPKRDAETALAALKPAESQLGIAPNQTGHPILKGFSDVRSRVPVYSTEAVPESAGYEELLRAVRSLCVEVGKAAEKPLSTKLFGENCKLQQNASPRQEDEPILKLAKELESLEENVRRSREILTGDARNRYKPLVIPATIGCIMALAFGLGLRNSRAWWLHNERAQDEGQINKLCKHISEVQSNRLRELEAALAAPGDAEPGRAEALRQEIDAERSKVAAAEAQFDLDAFLRAPQNALNRVSPIEAVRYEDYRVKLYSKISQGRIKLEDYGRTVGAGEPSRPQAEQRGGGDDIRPRVLRPAAE